jgi:transglutaminase-like putative cysteine protease
MFQYALRAALFAASVVVVGMATAADEKPLAKAARSRTFEFTYAGAVTGLEPGKKARVWLPVPPSNAEQTVAILAKDLPSKAETGKDALYGNDILSFEAAANKEGEIPFSLKYRVTRKEVVNPGAEKDAPLDRLLQPDEKVPTTGKPLDLIKGKELPKDPMKMGRLFYDVVNAHMKYSKEGTGWGRGDSVWACESGFGNCTDFHSLFISLARSQKIPATFIIGFPLPEKKEEGEIPGYHCWAKFKPNGDGWVAVDISEANKNPRLKDYYFGNLTADRVAFSTGRDITLVPKAEGKPLNFFVYPYVEVDGKSHDKMRKRFTFKDVAEKE